MSRAARILSARREARLVPAGRSKRMTPRTLAQVESADARVFACGDDANRIYVLRQRDGRGYIKIGTTIDLEKRIGDHQGNAYGELDVLAVFHGDRRVEQSLHARFWKSRVFDNREHFHQTREVLRWVEDVQRLNFRDGGKCWACRDASLASSGLVVDIHVSAASLAASVERVDATCGERCRSVTRWFDRSDRTVAYGMSGYGGNLAPTPSVVAERLGDATDDDAVMSWALNVLSASLASKNTRFHIRAARSLDALGAKPYCYDGRSKQFFPDGRCMYWEGDEKSPADARAHIRYCFDWLRSEVLGAYGIAKICCCKYIEHDRTWEGRLSVDRPAKDQLDEWCAEAESWRQAA